MNEVFFAECHGTLVYGMMVMLELQLCGVNDTHVIKWMLSCIFTCQDENTVSRIVNVFVAIQLFIDLLFKVKIVCKKWKVLW